MNAASEVKLSLRDRFKAVARVEVDELLKLLEASKFPGITKKLIRETAENNVWRIDDFIDRASEQELLAQIFFVRDQVLPFLIGDENPNSR